MCKTERVEERTKIEGFPSALGQRLVFRFLSAQAYSGAELYFPTDASAIEEKYVGACRTSKVKISSPIDSCCFDSP